MKKNHLLFFTFLIIPAFLAAQELSPTVVSSAGSSENNLSWTLGEIAIETLSSSEGVLTQGFQQPGYTVETVIENNEFNVSIQVYPVPASDFISVKFSELQNGFELVLYNLQGEVVVRQQVESDETNLDLNRLSPSEYILNVINQENNLIKSYKIVKY